MQTTPITTGAAAWQTAPGSLGKDDFFKLLITQLRHQNPLEPMNDREFIAQLAQFSTLEQVQNVAAAVEALVLRQDVATAFGLVGKTVVVQGSDGKQVTGTVSAVRWTAYGIALVIDDKEYLLGSLVEVRA